LGLNAALNPADGQLNSLPTMGAAVLGSTLGVGLVTSAREGTTLRNLAISAGAGAVGGAAVWLMAGSCGRAADCGDKDFVLRNLAWQGFLLLVPLVIEMVHGLQR